MVTITYPLFGVMHTAIVSADILPALDAVGFTYSTTTTTTNKGI